MATRRSEAKNFVKTWGSLEKGREDADRQTFWNDLLQRVYGINNYYDYITFEKQVQVKDDNGKITTRRIDAYIPSTKVMIEMKGKNVTDLSKPELQSGGTMLTPYEQAKRYANFLPQIEQPRWIVVSNFNEIDIYDMNKPLTPPNVILLSDLPNKFKSLEFMIDDHQQQFINEKKISLEAGELVAKIYKELTEAYSLHADINNQRIQKSLNMLIVRLVFLMYADDTAILGRENLFEKFIEKRSPSDIRQALIELFKILNQDPDKGERNPFISDEYKQFAYVNGGMFANEDIVIPQFTPELKKLIVDEAGKGFNWSNISPTIFGAVFESTLNEEKRRSGGMHYTSIENIHKVIDPLFLNDLRAELDHIQNMGVQGKRIENAKYLQRKISNLNFFDPACGSGNFLTETYISLRKIENECLKIIHGGDPILATEEIVKVRIQNFYGIEVNDFAVSVARTALWIAENQMLEQTKDVVYYQRDFLPLDRNDNIFESNALTMDWHDVIKPERLDYIMGNPPFIGKKYQNINQKDDLIKIFGKKFPHVGSLDYVAGWFEKASKFIQGTTIKVAFVSTNSICQGELVDALWGHLINDLNISLNFAYRTFIWENEAKKAASVFCVIIGFSCIDIQDKTIWYEDNTPISAKHISPYLIPGNDITISSSSKVLKPGIPPMKAPNKPCDYNTLKLSLEEKNEFIKKCPDSSKWIKQMIGARELMQGTLRYCLWLVGITPHELQSLPPILDRVKKCRQERLEHNTKESRKLADTPTLFREQENPKNYLAVPAVSSQNREYIPMDFLHDDKIPVMGILIVPDANNYLFGVMESKIHMAWTRTITGRLKGDYRYSKDIDYNNFPWPDATKEQKEKVAQTGKKILIARSKNPESSLSDLYDPNTMPIELLKAHKENDNAVADLFGYKHDISEPDIVDDLFKRYAKLIKK